MKALYKKLIYIFIIPVFCGGFLISCADLDIAPPNVLQDQDVFGTKDAMYTYMSRLYSQMPFEDFKYSPKRQFFDDWLGIPDSPTGMVINRDDVGTLTSEGGGRNGAYWTRAFASLRDANYLLENIEKYKSNFSESDYNHFRGEAYFTRGMVFYEMAKRYGGVPLVLTVLNYPENSVAQLETPRATEEETWDQVLKDFDQAVQLLNETAPKRGLADKNTALGFKSEAMLYAGSVAKYNQITGFGQKTGVRVIGFDPATSAATSRKYFTEAYKAAREIMKKNKYSLYMADWAAGNKNAQYQNMVNMFFAVNSPENIYIKEYIYPYSTHSFDAYAVPRQLMGGNGYSGFADITLDYVELFDGLPKNPNGTIKVFDKDGPTPDARYILYDSPMDLFKDAEPRLRAFVVLPMDEMKGEKIEIRRGTYTGDVTNGIAPLMSVKGNIDYNFSGSVNYTNVDAYNGTGKYTEKVLYGCGNASDQRTPVTFSLNGKDTTINASGRSGPFNSDNVGAFCGFTLRKYVNPAMPNALEGNSTQHFIMMRYAEILLNAAEAAAELQLAGETTMDGDDLKSIAYNAIRDIRERAGADPLVAPGDLDGQSGLMLIRKERKKELAFEWKIAWDVKRWRTQHSEVINGSTMADGVYFRGLMPFYSTKANKYFFDARFEENNYRFRITENEYYFAIPGDEVSKSPLIDQQPNR